MKYIVLHNIHDKTSRDFVASLPNDGNHYCIIDWYSDDSERFSRTCKCCNPYPYTGPPPRAFPSVLVTAPNGTYALVEPQTLADLTDATKFFSHIMPNTYAGGQTHDEVANNVITSCWLNDEARARVTSYLGAKTTLTDTDRRILQAINIAKIAGSTTLTVQLGKLLVSKIDDATKTKNLDNAINANAVLSLMINP